MMYVYVKEFSYFLAKKIKLLLLFCQTTISVAHPKCSYDERGLLTQQVYQDISRPGVSYIPRSVFTAVLLLGVCLSCDS